MAISRLAPAASSGPSANAVTCASPNTLYGMNQTFNPGIYTITCVNTTVARVEFYSNINTLITMATTISGTVTINLASTADRIKVWTDTGTNVVVTITLTAGALTNTISGTVDTITSSGTYTGTSTSGYGFVAAIGGGGGGGGTVGGVAYAGGGGGSGGFYTGIIPLTGSIAVTIGTGGAGGGQDLDGSSGTSTVFGSITATGGGGGKSYSNGHTGGIGGTPNGITATNPTSWNSGNGATLTTGYTFFTGSATIGAGGSSGNDASIATNGSGKGSGGGGGGASNGNIPARNGGNGAPGVVYVLKF